MSRENGIILASSTVVGLVAVGVTAGYPGFQFTRFSIFFFVVAVGVAIFGLWKYRPKKTTGTAIHLHLQMRGIKITTPANNDLVSFLQVIGGTLDQSVKWVQVLILANDGYWYLQGQEVVIVGKNWSTQCQFGSNERKSRGKPYKVVATTGTEQLQNGTKLKHLPNNLRYSNTVEVKRSLSQ
jgi:hypothetical protein